MADKRDCWTTEGLGATRVSDDLEYKGYTGSVEFSREDRLFFGKILFIDSLLMFHGQTVDELEAAFQETVDRYLAHCETTGKSPNKPYSGTFNVRIGSDRHKALAEVAYRSRVSINEIICKAIDCYLPHGGAPVLVTNHHHHEMVVKVLREEEVTFATQPFALSEPQWKIWSAQQH